MITMIKRLALTLAFAGSLAIAPVAPALAQADAQGYTITVTQVDTSKFPQVSVYVSVTDAQGNPVATIPDSEFALTENGQPMTINEVFQAGEQGPVSTALTIDRSGSMNKSGKLEAAKNAANAFVDQMRPEDQIAIVLFNTEVEVAQPLTHDKAALHSAINAIAAFNDTAMYDAIQQSVGVLSGAQGRRVIVLLSDGLDNRSQQTLDTITGGLDQTEISVYTVGLGDPNQGVEMSGIDETSLRTIADRSRGGYTFAPDPSQLQQVYQQISTRLQNEYRLTYTSPSALRDGVRRGLEVRLSAAAVQVNYNPGGLIPETATALDWPAFAAIALGLVALLALPDAIRGLGSMSAIKSPFKKKSRVKLMDNAATKAEAPSSRNSAPRVRVRGKSG